MILIVLFTLSATLDAGQAGSGLSGTIVDEQGRPLPGAHIIARNIDTGKEISADAGSSGDFAIELSAGTYDVIASLDGFQTVTDRVALPPARKLQVVLPVLQDVSESVTVTGSDQQLLEKEEPQTKGKLDERTMNYAPMAQQRFQDALPLIPSVVRGPDGNISISGARASENSLLVNGTNVTDPVTGNFAIDLPIEAVETVDVYTNPYSAEYGRFTGGVTSISTRAGEDRFRVQINDFIPRLHFVDGLKTEGVEAWMPRIRFSGPAGTDHLYFSQAFQYKYLRTFFKDLPGDPSTDLQSIDSLTQFDYLPDERNQWSFTASVFPENTDNVNLSTFLPVPSTPDFKQRGFSLAGTNRHFFSDGSFLESLVSYKSYDVTVLPKEDGTTPFLVAPEGMSGSFFNNQDRDSSRYQWTETFTFRPMTWKGAHQLKAGTELGRTTYSGFSLYAPVEILREDGSLAQRIDFSGDGQLLASTWDVSAYLQDRWQPGKDWSIDAGLRFDSSSIAGDANIAPRLALSYAPARLPKTVLRGGIGIFYDKIYLNTFNFDDYPERSISSYDESGRLLDSTTLVPRTDGPIRMPYSLTWNAALDQQVGAKWLLRLNYLRRAGRDQFVVEPLDASLVLSQSGRSSYYQWELTSQCKLTDESRLLFSYVYSSSRGDLNDFDTYFGNFQKPIIRQNQYSYLPSDATHRFLSWGVVRVPWKVYVSPVLEVRSGFRYSAVNDEQFFVGVRNSYRFPVFAQLDLRVTRTFEIKKYKVMLGVKVFNLLNHFNPRDVQNNLASPSFGTFYNGLHRTYRAAFEIQY